MPEPFEPDPAEDGAEGVPGAEAVEVVDGLPVLAAAAPAAQPGVFQRALPAERLGAVIPAVQAAAVAAGGFVAGAAVVGLVNRHQRRTPALAKSKRAGRELGRGRAGRGAKGAEVLQVLSSSTYLVDVHLLGTPGSER